MTKKKVLGRGLSALIKDADDVNIRQHTHVSSVSAIQEIKIEDIRPNSSQPRTEFNEEGLEELATSIKHLGLVQPITVRVIENGKYEIIAGERRYRASKMVGRTTIPAYVKDTKDDNILELALIENIQREDLNAIEIAISYQRLLEECNLTQDALSERIGKKRATIANYIRLLKLPAEIQFAVRDNKISMGHARALLAATDEDMQIMLLEQILKFDFSVRQIEETIKEILNQHDPTPEQQKKTKTKDIGEYIELQKHLSDRFSTKVVLKRTDKGSGKIEIAFKSDAELEKILEIMDKL